MKKHRTIVQAHKGNFETLRAAFASGDAALMECTIKATGEKVAVICAVSGDGRGGFAFTPFAQFYNGNPYEILDPPEGCAS